MRKVVWIALLTLGLILGFSASPAYAWHCPKLAGDVKAVIAKAETMGGNKAVVKKAKKLLNEGLEQHMTGKHNTAMNTLASAMDSAVHSVTQKKGGMSKKKGYGW